MKIIREWNLWNYKRHANIQGYSFTQSALDAIPYEAALTFTHERAVSILAIGVWRAVVLVFFTFVDIWKIVKLKINSYSRRGTTFRLIRSTAPLFQSLSILNWKKNEDVGEIAHQYRIPRHLGNHDCTCTRTSPQCFGKRPLESSCACFRCTHPRLLRKW